MKKIALIFTLLLAFSCGSSKSTSEGPSNLQANLDKKNRATIPLVVRIRQKPGIILKNGVPALQKADNSFSSSSQEPLYILNDQIIGSSFASIDNLIESYMVKKIEVISGADASFYGARGANGVIKIITFSGEDDGKVKEK
ncbi:MAG: hypothetical protein AAF039_07920 [Bacteroidota bacterium]